MTACGLHALPAPIWETLWKPQAQLALPPLGKGLFVAFLCVKPLVDRLAIHAEKLGGFLHAPKEFDNGRSLHGPIKACCKPSRQAFFKVRRG